MFQGLESLQTVFILCHAFHVVATSGCAVHPPESSVNTNPSLNRAYSPNHVLTTSLWLAQKDSEVVSENIKADGQWNVYKLHGNFVFKLKWQVVWMTQYFKQHFMQNRLVCWPNNERLSIVFALKLIMQWHSNSCLRCRPWVPLDPFCNGKICKFVFIALVQFVLMVVSYYKITGKH